MRNIFLKNKEHDISKKTKYDLVKSIKRDNFNFLNKTVCEKNQTILIGDSISEIFNVTDLFFEYTQNIGLAVYNRGISGDTSDRLLERLSENALCLKPRNLVILIGTNDLGVNAPPDFTIENIKKIISLAKDECPDSNIILQGIYPVNNHFSVPMVGLRKNKDISYINSELKLFAENSGIIFADFTNILADDNGQFNKKFTYDGLHPNAVGFFEVAKALIPLLK